jgi:hypothetical protein
MLINVIHDFFIREYFKSVNKGTIPKKIKEPVIYKTESIIPRSDVSNFFTKMFNAKPDPVKFTYSDLEDRYLFLRDVLKPSQAKKLFEDINIIFFKLEVAIRWVEEKRIKPKNEKAYSFGVPFTEVFSNLSKGVRACPLLKINILRLFSNGRGLSDFEFNLDFTTFFGCCAIQGLRYINFDVIPEEIYTEESINDFSKLFYIFFMAGRSKRELRPSEIAERLELKTKDIYQTCSFVERCLDELTSLKFIQYEKRGKTRNRRYVIFRKK